MTTKAIQPTNTSSIAHAADYEGHTQHGDGRWSIKVRKGVYQPPEGWTVESVLQLSTGSLVRIRREAGDD